MKIDERIVLQIPKSAFEKSNLQRTVWVRRLISRAIMDARAKILEETQEDIFNVFVMTDCVEITIKGELETKHVEKSDFKPWMNKKWKRLTRIAKKGK